MQTCGREGFLGVIPGQWLALINLHVGTATALQINHQ